MEEIINRLFGSEVFSKDELTVILNNKELIAKVYITAMLDERG